MCCWKYPLPFGELRGTPKSMHPSASLFLAMPQKEGQRPKLWSAERVRLWLDFHRWFGHHNGCGPILFFNWVKFGFQTSSYIHTFHTTDWFTCSHQSHWCHLHWYSDTPSLTEGSKWREKRLKLATEYVNKKMSCFNKISCLCFFPIDLF